MLESASGRYLKASNGCWQSEMQGRPVAFLSPGQSIAAISAGICYISCCGWLLQVHWLFKLIVEVGVCYLTVFQRVLPNQKKILDKPSKNVFVCLGSS